MNHKINMIQIPVLTILATLVVVTHCIERNFDQILTYSNLSSQIGPNSFCPKQGNGQTALEFQHITLSNGDLYLGSTNHILQVNPATLSLSRQLSIGPGNDSVQCTSGHFCSQNPCGLNALHCTDNYNHFLLKYRYGLLTCGTLYKACQVLDTSGSMLQYKGDQRNIQCGINLPSDHDKSVKIVASLHERNGSNRDLLYTASLKNDIEVFLTPDNFTDMLTRVYYFNPIGTREFILSWTDSNYAYMLGRQVVGNHAVLIRFCHESFNSSTARATQPHTHGSRSYTEMPLVCQSNGVNFTNPFHAYQSDGRLFVLYKNNINDSILCSSTISSINSNLDEARRKCWIGSPTSIVIVLDNIVKNQCPTVPSDDNITKNTCQVSSDFDNLIPNPSIRSFVAMQMNMEISWGRNMENPTSFAVASANGGSIAFIGTDTGAVKKVLLGSSPTLILETSRSPIRESVIDIVTDQTNRQVIAITKNQIVAVGYSDCARYYTTCASCLNGRDPLCGWCVLSNSCSNKESCFNSNNGGFWIQPTSPPNSCPRIASLSSSDIVVNSAENITLNMIGNSLPSGLPNPYICEFRVSGTNSPVIPNSNLVGNNCVVNTASSSIVQPGFASANVSLLLTYNGTTVTSANLRVFDCSRFKELNTNSMCTSCVTSPPSWNCIWCNDVPYSCSHINCPAIVTSQVNDSSHCPRVLSVASPTAAISSGKRHDFQLRTSNLRVGVSYMCRFNFCGSSHVTTSATINGASMVVSCSITAQQFTCPAKEFAIQVSLYTGSYVVDANSVAANTVQGFNCSAQSQTCGQCVAFHLRHNECGWCAGGCQLSAECTTAATTSIVGCGSPVITSVSPLSGPLEGGTILSITGTNLASSADQIINVTVGTIPCQVIRSSYVASLSFDCKTGKSGNVMDGTIILYTNYSNTPAELKEPKYFYKNVTATSFQPLQVLNSTNIDIIGSNLNAGGPVKLVLWQSDLTKTAGCSIRTSSKLTCKLPDVSGSGLFRLQLVLDAFVKNFSQPIEYVAPPTTVPNQPSKFYGFTTGKGTLTLSLTGVLGVRTVKLQIDNGTKTDCNFNINATVTCIIPSNPVAARKRRNVGSGVDKPAQVLLNDVHVIWQGTVSFVADPVLSRITDLPCKSTTATPQSRANVSDSTTTILIPGSNLALMEPKPSDYKVSLVAVDLAGAVPCTVTFVTSTSLVCSAVSTQLDGIKSKSVSIQVSYRNWTLPSVEAVYCRQSDTVQIVVAIVIPLMLILILIIAFQIYRQRMRAKKQVKERKVILGKLDELENKTRETARNAYFELQAGYMTNLTDNLSHRIIYLSPWEYLTQILFNQSSGHPVLDDQAMVGQGTIKLDSLKSLLSLIKNKDVLMILIKTLEEQRKFTVQEKGNMASLLTVCLFDDLPYFTRIMLDLLKGLIQKHVARNPKLLLRRSESVVEKMVSHWLSIMLYDECINEQAGKPLFLLTKAVHYLVSSAPCDVIANKAFNSLNEMTLLGTELTYETMVIHAAIVEAGGGVTNPVEVKVVNVDSITQAKTKVIEAVYKDRPYSECPKPEDLDFELMNSSESTGIVLSDIDKMSVVDGKYTKLNTLKHYNVPTNAVVLLRPHDPENLVIQDSQSALLPKKHLYHLINPSEQDQANGVSDVNENASKKADAMLDNLMKRPFQEMFLTRMVKAKATIQEYVDGVFNAILKPKPVSMAVRYFFHFLDQEAEKHKITDPEILHIWKTNSLLLRYWVNVLKNPEFVFDTNKTPIVDSCLNVITQAFMDACTTTNRKLGHDSPSNKLLYAKDAETYRVMVKEFFVEVASTPVISSADIEQILQKQSASYAARFNQMVALNGIYDHLVKYREQVNEALTSSENNEEVQEAASKLEEIFRRIGGERNSNTTVV